MSRRHRKPVRHRSLSLETLEGRRLLVVGEVPPEILPQNFANPEDTNYDGTVSPADALIVVNQLNNGSPSGSRTHFSSDVDGDGSVSPRDALLVINRLNSGSVTSSVPPQQRAIGLRQALDAGIIPPNMTLSAAQEMLETLERGGHYEAGDRYRNGQMLNINQPLQDFGGAEAESAGTNSTEPSVETASERLAPEVVITRSHVEDDPFALLESADDTCTDPLHDPTLWQVVSEATDARSAELIRRVSIDFADRLAESLSREDARERISRILAEAVQSGDGALEDIIIEVAGLQATLADANSQIAQLFASLDVNEILDRIGVDLRTLAEAVVSSGHSDRPDHDEPDHDRPDHDRPDHGRPLGQFLRREYRGTLDMILP